MKKTNPTPYRLLAAVLLVAIALVATGCVSSAGRAAYTAHVTHRMVEGGKANQDVAIAFGLDEHGEQDGAIASVPDAER